MRFLVDEDISPCLKFILEEWGHEADAAVLRSDLRAAADEDLSNAATKENRTLVTFNIVDFEELHDQYQQTGRCHGGIVVCREQRGYQNFRRLLRWMQNMLKTVPLNQFPNTLHYLHTF